MRRVIGNLASIAFGAVDGVVKNADLAASRTQVFKQRSAWLEGAAALVGLALVAIDSPVGEGLLYGAESVVAERGGMWAGLQLTKLGPGRMEMPQLIDTTMVPMPMGGDGHYLGPNPMGGVGFGGGGLPSIYPAQREPAGILG